MYRIYRERALDLGIKPWRRITRDKPDALSLPTTKNQVWSMDFMSDALGYGRIIRTFNVMDDYNREGLTIEVDFSLPAQRVIRSLQHVIQWRGKPQAIRCEMIRKYISAQLRHWAQTQGITLMYIPNREMPTLNGLSVPYGMNGSTCMCLTRLHAHSYWPHNGFGATITRDRIPQLEAYRLNDY